jgi:mycothiol system anti-sigma-R factor
MNCHDAQASLHPYLDGELDLTTTVQVEQHVQACPACAAILAEQKGLQTAMKADALYYKAPENLRQRLRASIRATHGGRRLRIRWSWAAAAACMLLCVGVGFLMAHWTLAASRAERLAQEVASSHIRSLQAEKKRLVDVESSDRHEVKPWLTDNLDFAPPTPDLAKHDFTLVGGRLDYLDGRPVATLVYQRRKHVISVFIWPDATNVDTPIRKETRQGFHLISWSRAGMNYWVVSDLDPTELNELAQRLRE